MTSLRFWAVIALLSLAAVTLHVRGDVDHVPASIPLDQFPRDIAGWSGSDIPIEPDALQILGNGVFLDRLYRPTAPDSSPGAGAANPVSLFIGYFPTQRSGQSIHSPQNCLPGSGWSFESSGTVRLTSPSGPSGRVGSYVVTDGQHRAVVLYWYQSHGRMIANDYQAKFDMLLDAIRYQRTDAALVRVVAPLGPADTPVQAQQRAIRFAQWLLPLLPAFVPN